MTVPASRVRRRPRTPGRLLPLLLATALLLPVAFLVVQGYRLVDTDRELAERERLGVEYLRALGPVTEALVDAQTAAVAGRPVPRDALDRAVEEAAAVDARVGGELRSTERWAGLRAKLEGLPSRSLTDPETAFTAYGEVTDLLLALHGKIRETSGLIRDPGSDSYFLQDGVGEEMPEATVAAGRLVDLAVLAQRRPAADQARTVGELATLRFAALQPAGDLVNDLQTVVDTSESADIGADVLTPFDKYQRAVEALGALSQPRGRTQELDVAKLAAARTQAQTAARELQPVLLDEIDRLLRQRIDQLDRDALLILAAGGVAGLLLVALGASGWLTRRRGDRPTGRDTPAVEPADATGPAPWDPPTPPGRLPTGPVLQPAGRGTEPDRWRPFDAAR
ncbi:hypothetical protein ACWDUH_07625 [Micromonospora wenchangensis]|uniref:Nitrate/nitrite sensing protein domain-containing protein n=1 Tax=Micromonospora wenchangensis TaxID=1185415 RepID=A0A246RPZ6_9ACTN|nr:hypothetical protein [Micromonospora wenchangensis]OWV09841.1 hypothetical protein B5D80_08310 [Micromonospora wenchangensis]